MGFLSTQTYRARNRLCRATTALRIDNSLPGQFEKKGQRLMELFNSNEHLNGCISKNLNYGRKADQ
jgi:hypothetical protein